MKRILLLLVGTGLAGCGLREPLQPPPGGTMPPAPAMARRAPTTEEMLTPPPIARPERVGELLSRSEARSDDRFDLPPPDIPAGQDPVPTDEDDKPE